jgi:hypothetical protein
MVNIKTECTNCKKEIILDKWWYNYRLKRNNNRGIFCSAKCGRIGQAIPPETKEKLSLAIKKACDEGRRNLSPFITVECAQCKKPLTMKRYTYNQKVKRNKRDQFFCSIQCSSTGVKFTEERIEKIRRAQIGIAKPQCGRKGRITSEETRKKISNSRRGIKSTCDWDIVISDAHELGLTNYVVTRKPLPDIIYAENNKLVAIEVEKKTNESDAKRKMLEYENMNGYEKVIIIWHSRGIKRKEWVKTKLDPNWKETVFS